MKWFVYLCLQAAFDSNQTKVQPTSYACASVNDAHSSDWVCQTQKYLKKVQDMIIWEQDKKIMPFLTADMHQTAASVGLYGKQWIWVFWWTLVTVYWGVWLLILCQFKKKKHQGRWDFIVQLHLTSIAISRNISFHINFISDIISADSSSWTVLITQKAKVRLVFPSPFFWRCMKWPHLNIWY